MLDARDHRRPGGWRAHVRGAGDRSRRERRRDPASRSFTVDTAAPQTTIDSGPSGPTSDATPTFAFSSSRGGLDVRVPGRRRRLGFVLDTRDHRLACGRRTHLRGARHGPAGNVDRRRLRAASRWTRPRLTPRSTVGPSGPTNDATPTFVFSADQAGSSFECRVDGGAWGSCSTPETTGPLADGAHTFEVRATDLAGNVDPTRRRAASRSTPLLRTPRSTAAPWAHERFDADVHLLGRRGGFDVRVPR